MNLATLIWLILLTPLSGFILSVVLGRNYNQLVANLTTFLSLLNLLFSFWLWKESPSGSTSLIFNWFSIQQQAVQFGFLINPLTQMMLLLVNFIALLVQLFSMEYMAEEPAKYRYFGFLSLFVFSMLGIVLTNNLFVMYCFWELVGLSSYLLIGFWYRKPEAVEASKKAFLVNRVGDIGFLLGIFLVFYQFGTTDFTILKDVNNGVSAPMLTLTGLLLFCGCIGKSAQFPLHTWLPDAMEGPTPVSALIHAATMVAAGIFLLARVQPIFTADVNLTIAVIGTITMLLGAIYAIFQTDIKKVLAYSTISQLGLMLLGLGTEASVFHLLTHAFFKAGLFLSAGSIIHALHHAGHGFDAQDMRLMGGLRKRLPFTFVCYLICSMALAGLPLFSGFLSKDAILMHLLEKAGESRIYFIFLGLAFLGVGLTAFYMTRQIWMIFGGALRNDHIASENIHESSLKVKLPLGILSVLSIGFVFSVNPLSAGDSWFWHFISPETGLMKHEENHWIAIGSVTLATIGIAAGYLSGKRVFSYQIPTFDPIYNRLLVIPTLSLSVLLQKFDKEVFDKVIDVFVKGHVVAAHMIAWFDRFFVDGLANLSAFIAGRIGSITRSFQGGKLQMYVVWALVGLMSLIFFVISQIEV